MDGETKRVVKRRFRFYRCERLTQLSCQTLAILEIIFEIYIERYETVLVYLYFKDDFKNLALNN